MCCIVLESLYLCYVIGKERLNVEVRNPHSKKLKRRQRIAMKIFKTESHEH
ncbi:MAG: hypothetical protein JWQ27_1623 [Ferruginibacter sp.]|nr:hypothetical protein [Ferruginibacter sp.]